MVTEERERVAVEALEEHFRLLRYEWPGEAARHAMSLDGPESRATFIESVVGEHAFGGNSVVLVSGAGAGSEMLCARHHGAAQVYGTEVDSALVSVCNMRFAGQAGLTVSLYDGASLDWPDEHFDAVLSGHVIEHTADPQRYLEEHIRVLRAGGWMFLEFPTRYHWRELHTRLPSLEWLPTSLRNAGLRILSAAWTPLPASVRRRYRSILDTGLQQVSVRDVKRWARRPLGEPLALVATATPVAGVVRTIWFRTP